MYDKSDVAIVFEEWKDFLAVALSIPEWEGTDKCQSK